MADRVFKKTDSLSLEIFQRFILLRTKDTNFSNAKFALTSGKILGTASLAHNLAWWHAGNKCDTHTVLKLQLWHYCKLICMLMIHGVLGCEHLTSLYFYLCNVLFAYRHEATRFLMNEIWCSVKFRAPVSLGAQQRQWGKCKPGMFHFKSDTSLPAVMQYTMMCLIADDL